MEKFVKKYQILAIFVVAEIHEIDLEASFFRILQIPKVKI